MKAKIAAALLTLAAVGTVLMMVRPQEQKTPKMMFEDWKSQFGTMMSLREEEEAYRFGIFQDNLKIINEHNALLGRSYDMGINQFSIFTNE